MGVPFTGTYTLAYISIGKPHKAPKNILEVFKYELERINISDFKTKKLQNHVLDTWYWDINREKGKRFKDVVHEANVNKFTNSKKSLDSNC